MSSDPGQSNAIAALVRRLADPVEEVADAALAALTQFGPAALPAILAATADGDADRAMRAVRWLGIVPEVSATSSELDEGLVTAMRDARTSLRAAGAEAAGQVQQHLNLHLLMYGEGGSPTPDALGVIRDELCTCCGDPDPLVREAAALALAFAPGSAPVVEALVSALNDNSSRAVREAAARSLGALATRLAPADLADAE